LQSFGFVRAAGTGVFLAAQTTLSDGRPPRLGAAPPFPGFGTCDTIEVDGKAQATGCGAPGGPPGGLAMVGLGGPDDPSLDTGFGPPGTVQVRLTFADGRTVVLDAPRRGWLRERTATERQYAHELARIEYLDRAGHEIGQNRLPVPTPPPTGRGGGRPWPASGGSRCGWRAPAPAGRAWSSGARTGSALPRNRAPTCRRLPSDRSSTRRASQAGSGSAAGSYGSGQPESPGHLVILGLLPKGATALELRFGGRHVEAHVRGSVYYLELRQAPGRRLTSLVARRRDGRVQTSLALDLPRTGVFEPAWHGALYTMVTLGPFNSLGYSVGPISWPSSP
jgi:hypothetical protein